jgi:ribosomal protein L24
MAVKLKIKKGATVEVIAGSDKGKKGTVIDVNAKSMKIKPHESSIKLIKEMFS